MNTEGLVWFENLNMNPEGDYRYYAYRNPKIKEGYLHETYNGYGCIVDESDTGDYSVAALTMNRVLEEALREEFGIGEDVEIELESVDSTPEFEEIEVTADGETDKRMSEYATKYARENSVYVKAKWFDYHDGSNWQSVIIECDTDDAVTMRIVTDEELTAELNAVAEKFNNHCEQASKSSEIDGHTIGCSLWQNDPWACYVD